MKRQNIYKQIALSLLLLVGMAGTAWGQGASSPGTVSYGAGVDVSKDIKLAIGNITSDNTVNTANNSSLNAIYDGTNQWCAFNEAGAVTLNISMQTPYFVDETNTETPIPNFVIEKILIQRGANATESPVSVKIQYGNDDSFDESDPSIEFESLTPNSSSNVGKLMLLTLNKPIEARYLSVTLTPQNTSSDKIALDEMTLYGYCNLEVKHKQTKWQGLRNTYSQNKKPDSFSSDSTWFNRYGHQIQPAHHYVDTIYMKKGDTYMLILPDRNTNATNYGDLNSKSYQRWYDYETDGLAETLTPTGTGTDMLMKITNGYLSIPYKNLVITAEDGDGSSTQIPYQMKFTYPIDSDKDSYIIACDVSNYTDLNIIDPEEGSSVCQLNEPTLNHRILYYIKAIPENMGNNYYHEEYNISFPFTRISNHTLDLVALSKDADAYAFNSDNGTGNNEGLTVKINSQNNSAKITLAAPTDNPSWYTINDDGTEATISGNHRTIFFAYPNTRDDGTQFVGESTDDGETDNLSATIEVTKKVGETEYKIATYNLTFKRNTVLLTQSIIDGIGKEEGQNNDGEWDKYEFRTPTYLQENYGAPLTELNWDYDKITIGEGTNYNDNYYLYPMAWDYSTYGFYDGSKGAGIATIRGESPYTEWGHYAITNQYIETLWGSFGGEVATKPKTALKNSEGDDSSFHLYVDASDRPGTIARLTFPEILCAGSEIFVSAWVKSASSWGIDENSKQGTSDDAAMLFTIMGVRKDDNGNIIERVPLYRHCTGQIRNTLYISEDIPGCGGTSNEWLQLYFTFINGTEQFDEYQLQVDNYSASTQGGDMYLDDVRCYVMKPKAVVEQDEPTCDDRPVVNMRLGWEQLESRLAGTKGESATAGAIDFCIIDVDKYEKSIQANSTDLAEAIRAAAVYIGNGIEGEGGYNQKYATLWYNWNFDANTQYNDPNNGNKVLAIDNPREDGNYYFYKETDEITGVEYLSVDFHAALIPTYDYALLIIDHASSDADITAEDFVRSLDEDCGLYTEFEVQGQNIITMNGEVVGATEIEDRYCIGQTFNFAIQLRVKTGADTDENNGWTTYQNENIYYDWFFGNEDAYKAPSNEIGNSKTVNVSVEAALEAFRVAYPDATGITDDIVATEDGFSADHLKLLKYLTTNTPDGARNPQLILYKRENEIRILETGLNLTIRPIRVEITDINADLICWQPLYLQLKPSGSKSPKLNLGFGDVTYPNGTDGWSNPALRIGLAQIKAAPVESGGETINIPLRNAAFAFPNSTASYLGKLSIRNGETVTSDFDDELYLNGTNDPELIKQIGDNLEGEETFHSHDYSIGKLVDLYAKPHADTDTDYSSDVMKIQFYNEETEDNKEGVTELAFTPREGYWYQFGIHFEEKYGDGTSTQEDTNEDDEEPMSGCYGNLIVRMHVVPEYQKWIGDATDNWNNDENWARSSSTELKKASNSYTDYDDDDLLDSRMPGYVPMKFTKVTIPKEEKVELYNSTASGTTHKILDLTTNEETNVTGPATLNIEYDLLVNPELDDNAYVCEPYYTNKVDQIHFEPKAEMLHAELLTYDTAWVDYKLTKGQWYTLASPLQGIVAGDFYTDGGKIGTDNVAGIENQEYFTPITFEKDDETNYNNANNNSRFSPSVYQRGWKANGATMIGVGEGDSGERAVAGNWSAVYNNVYEKYNPGEGFSVKALDFDGDEAIFRLPKKDESYKYYSNESQEATDINNDSSTSFSRSGNGKLKISQPDENVSDSELFKVELEANGDYYLVGNPFMAYLDAKAFFTANSSLGSSYWYADNGVQNIISVADEDLISTDKGTIPPLHSFFVKKVENVSNPVTVTFKNDMQVLGGTTEGTTNTNALILTAKTADGKMSRAAIAYDMSADKDYAADEDAELFLDSNLSDVPAIYTVAGTMATSINRTSELYNIPVGIYGHSTEMVTLSFEGLKHFSSATLYDAEKKTETPLREGTTLTVPASTSGRYFLRAGTPTGNEVLEADDIQIYTLSGNRVMVTSSKPLKDIRVYNLGGALTKHMKAGVCSFELYLPDGIYIVTAENANGEVETEKVSVR